MRPAQLTPENSRNSWRNRRRSMRFNEAGAINAGKPREVQDRLAVALMASMRPAQLTPENPPWTRRTLGRRSRGFNEAGAINAGKLILLVNVSCFRNVLQ